MGPPIEAVVAEVAVIDPGRKQHNPQIALFLIL
jgi:hypothetical protein